MRVQRDRPADEMTLGQAGLYAAASRSFNGPPVKRGEVAADVRGQALLIHRGAYFPRDRAQNDMMKAVIPGAGADLRHRSPDRLPAPINRSAWVTSPYQRMRSQTVRPTGGEVVQSSQLVTRGSGR